MLEVSGSCFQKNTSVTLTACGASPYTPGHVFLGSVLSACRKPPLTCKQSCCLLRSSPCWSSSGSGRPSCSSPSCQGLAGAGGGTPCGGGRGQTLRLCHHHFLLPAGWSPRRTPSGLWALLTCAWGGGGGAGTASPPSRTLGSKLCVFDKHKSRFPRSLLA